MSEYKNRDNIVIEKFWTDFEEHKFIFDNLDDVIWSMSWPDLKVQFISKAVEDIVGYSVEEFKEDPFLLKKITHPADKEINEKLIKNLKENGYAEREIRIIVKNGNVKWVQDKGKMVYDKNNNPVRVEGLMRDITQKKKAEKELENNKNRYQTIFNSAPIGFMLEDEKGTILEVNEVMSQDSGYSKEELKGSSVLDKFVLPEYQELAKDNIKKLIQGKDLEFDIKTPTKNGKMKYYHLKETNITLADGSTGIISMHLDITERKKLEKDLKEKNNLLNTVLESIQSGIRVINPDLTVLYANSRIKEWYKPTKPITGNKCFKVYDEQEIPCDNCPVQKSLKTGKMESTIKKMTADFDIDFIEIFSYPIWNENKNKITGVVELVRDISESLKYKKELEMMNFSINNAELLIFRVNPDGIIEYANETAFEQLGYDRDQLIGLKVENIIKNDQQLDRESYWEKLKSDESLNYELNYMTKKGKSFPVEITSQHFMYEDKEYEFVFAQDITERIEKEKEINYLAYKDSLTDLYNRKFFEAELESLDTDSKLPISIIMGDLNGLKIINDSYGKKKGDQLLTKTAKMLKEVVRDEDVLARYGGDEFIILLPQTTNKKAQKIIKKIKSKITEENKGDINLSISLGAATLSKKNQKITETLKRAEDKMFQNKLSESKSSKSNIVQGLLNTLSAKSSETKEHAIRMTKLAFDFGEKLNLSNFDLNKLSLLATLHDIGKTIIPESILEKPDKLNTKEWEMIKEHPKTGCKIASASKEFAIVADEILSHHERWDGKGYPNGLKGERIPYLARIITIIDSYDVMTNDRLYSSAISKKEALAEINRCAGDQFDPELAATFIEMMKNKL